MPPDPSESASVRRIPESQSPTAQAVNAGRQDFDEIGKTANCRREVGLLIGHDLGF